MFESMDAAQSDKEGKAYETNKAIIQASLRLYDEYEKDKIQEQAKIGRKKLIPLIEKEYKSFLSYINDIDKDAVSPSPFTSGDRTKNERKLLAYHLWFYTAEFKLDENDELILKRTDKNNAGNYRTDGDDEYVNEITRIYRKAFRERVKSSRKFTLPDLCLDQENKYTMLFTKEGTQSAGGFMYGLNYRIKNKRLEHLEFLPEDSEIKNTAAEWVETIAESRNVKNAYSDFLRKIQKIRRDAINELQ
jgi:hypothetical protein